MEISIHGSLHMVFVTFSFMGIHENMMLQCVNKYGNHPTDYAQFAFFCTHCTILTYGFEVIKLFFTLK